MRSVTLAVILFLATSLNAQNPSSVVRLHVVNVPVDSGLLAAILPEFEAATGYRVQVEKTGDEVYDHAREGKADLVISHYGHVGAEGFMAEGLGLWPRPVFANQAVLIGPAADPAGIRGLEDAVEAFRRIARSRSRFVLNNSPTEKYLSQTLWEAAGRPDRAEWFVDTGLREQSAIQAADRMNAYVVWGIVPFLKFKESRDTVLEPLVSDDQLFHRMMVSVVLNPERIAGINVAGAVALQKYLSAAATQAKIRAFRYTGFSKQIFWPSARDNSGAYLTDLDRTSAPNAPSAARITLEPASVRPGGSFTVTFSGTNLTAATYFDIRFRSPGGATDQIAIAWQQGSSGVHTVPAGTPAGVWTITGVRPHQEAGDRSGMFTPLSATLTVVN